MAGGPSTRAQMNAARTACSVCHQRKVRCDAHDGGVPCSNCRAASLAHECHIHQRRRRTSAMSRLKQRRPRAHIGAAAAAASTSLAPPLPPLPSARTAPSSSSPAATAWPSTASPPASRGNQGSAPPSRSGFAATPLRAAEDGDYTPVVNYLVEFLHQPQITERPIDKDARAMYVGTEVSNTNFLLRRQFGPETAPVSHYPTDRLARRLLCHEPDRLPAEAFQLPSKPVVDKMLDAYFLHVNPVFPVVDRDLFMAQYRARNPQNPPSLLLLHAMLVAAAHVLYERGHRQGHKAVFFHRAKTLFDARFERNRDTVVQAALLLSWHTDGAEDVVANAWFWIGVAARTALGLGMHRDAEKSTLVPHTKRMWRRVWWLLFQCDVIISMQYGRPQSLSLDDSDVQRLQPSDFQTCGPVQIEHCIQTAELCKIISRGMKDLCSPSRGQVLHARREALSTTDEKLATWLLQHQTALEPNPAVGLQLSGALLQVLYNTALILFHRRQPNQRGEDSDDTQQDDSSICISAANTIQQIFQHLCEQDQLKSVWVSGVNCLFTALIQLSAQVKIPNVVLAISAFKRYESALSSLRFLAEYWPNALSIVHFFEDYFRPNRVSNSVPQDVPPPKTRGAPAHAVSRSNGSRDATPSGQVVDGMANSGLVHRGLVPSSEEPVLADLSECAQHHVDLNVTMWLDAGAAANNGNGSYEVQDVLDAWQGWQSTSQCKDDFLFTF